MPCRHVTRSRGTVVSDSVASATGFPSSVAQRPFNDARRVPYEAGTGAIAP